MLEAKTFITSIRYDRNGTQIVLHPGSLVQSDPTQLPPSPIQLVSCPTRGSLYCYLGFCNDHCEISSPSPIQPNPGSFPTLSSTFPHLSLHSLPISSNELLLQCFTQFHPPAPSSIHHLHSSFPKTFPSSTPKPSRKIPPLPLKTFP